MAQIYQGTLGLIGKRPCWSRSIWNRLWAWRADFF